MDTSREFSSLIPALVQVLETSQRQDGLPSKQALLSTTNEFKETLAAARSTAANLPGGTMSIADQNEIIGMLEQVRNYKREQVQLFLRRYQCDRDSTS